MKVRHGSPSSSGPLTHLSSLSLILPSGGQWSDPLLKDLVNAELKVVVLNFADANGVMRIPVDRDRLDQERKLLALLQ